MSFSPSNIFITGPSRSGTTLTCVLLNKLSNFVALHEPFTVDSLKSRGWKNKDKYHKSIDRFVRSSRKSLLRKGLADSRQINGKITSDPVQDLNPGNLDPLSPNKLPISSFSSQGDSGINLRSVVHERRKIKIEKPLTNDFSLAIKHNLIFTSLLDQLVKMGRCYAIIRNPLSTLCSWNTINFALNQGKLPFWFEYWEKTDFHNITYSKDLYERQIRILEWFFESYRQKLLPSQIINYESLIETNGKCLEIINPNARRLNEELLNKNNNLLYPPELMETIGERLLKRDSVFWHFYEKSQVIRLMDNH